MSCTTEAVLASAGQELTEETIRWFKDADETFRGTVHTIIVYFRNDFTVDDLDFLVNAERNHNNRRKRYQRAIAHANRVQSAVRDYLWNDDHAGLCFGDCPYFTFEPDRHIRYLPVTNTLICPATGRLVEEIAKKDHVLGIDVDFPIYSIPHDPTEAPEAVALGGTGAATRHINGYTWGWNRLKVRDLHKLGVRGEGITIGVADTGAHANHPDIILKIKDFRTVMPSGDISLGYSSDRYGHGTHVTGTIVGENNSGVWIGGAPRSDVKVAAFLRQQADRKAGHTGAAGTFSGLVRVLDWFAESEVDIVNLSLGFKELSPGRKQLATFLFDSLRQQAILTVAAIGNNAGDCMYPARFKSVVGCGASDIDDNVWPESGQHPDFVLPGVDIFSCVPFGLTEFCGQQYAWMTGTSMAAAHMTGLLALCLEMQRNRPLNEIVKAFEETASNGGKKDQRSGWGIPDLGAAVKLLEG
jgi:subtilisin family serine protease